MSAESWAIVTLMAYALAAFAAVAFQSLQCQDGWKVWIIHAITRLHTSLICGQRILQKCPFPASGSGLVISNHRSPVDPFLLCSGSQEKRGGHCVRRVEFMTAREYVEMPGPVGIVCRVMACIPVERDGKDMGPAKETLRRLKAGHLVGIFPEGRINTGEGLLPANTGVAWLALRSKSPVLPAFIHDAPKGTTMANSFLTSGKARVSYGEPIDLSAYFDERPTPALLAEVTDLLMTKLGALGNVKPSPRVYPDHANHNDISNAAPNGELATVGAEG